MDIFKINGDLLRKLFNQSYAKLNSEKELINAMNVFPVPDGDTGTNMSLTMKSSIDMLNSKETDDVNEISRIVAKGALMGARGNSGVILSQILGGFSKGLENVDEIDTVVFLKALRGSVDKAYKSVMKPIEGTILTVIRESVEALEKKDVSNMGFEKFFSTLLYESKKSLENTPKYLSVLKQAGVVDSGGRGLVSVFQGFYNTIIGKEIEVEHSESIDSTLFEHDFENPEEIRFAYCTEFIIDGVDRDTNELKEYILSLGDSVVFVQDDTLVKTHVHTNDPGLAMQKALEFGHLVKVKVDNMKLQNKEFVKKESEKLESAVLSICLGDGFSDIFTDLGVSRIIDAGQTMNPSTEDIINAINKVHSDTIFILPNNSNILLAANQAKEISDKNVIVIPTKTVPQGISAMLQYDIAASVEENTEHMTGAIDDVDTCQITRAVRNTEMNGVRVKKNDAIAIYEGSLVSTNKNAEKLLKSIIEDNVNKFDFISIYYGEDVDIRKSEKIVEELRQKNPDVEIELYHGGQPVYYYILSLE